MRNNASRAAASLRCGRPRWFLPVAAISLLTAGHAVAQVPLSQPRPQAGGQFGFDVATMWDHSGEWNIIVGAPMETHLGRPGGGRVHVFSGENGARRYTIAPPTRQLMGSFGWSVTGTSDLNGDGRGDIIIGAPWEANRTGSLTGRAYLYSGADGRLLRAWVGQRDMSGFGWATALVPDINGDGVPDIAISAPFDFHPNRGTRTGRVFMYCGSTGRFIRSLVSPLSTEDGGFGLSIIGIDDVDGDGFGDVVVGAPNETGPGQPPGAGRVYIFSGATGRLLRVMGSPNQQADGRFGFSLAAGDLTGNGRQDLIIGAPGETPPGLPREAGRVYTYDGPLGTGLRHLTSPMPRRMGHFGNAITVMNDINGDGRNNLAIAAPGDFPLETPAGAGQVYIFAPTHWHVVRRQWSRQPQLNGRFGSAIAAMPDRIGNGRGELIVGAQQEDPTGVNPGSGRTYIYR